MRFDEVELDPVPLGESLAVPESADPSDDAPRGKRLLALLTDVSLFAALALALSPLLPSALHWTTVASLAGFVMVVSYYYFVGTWMLWGKTIGGAIFDVRVVADHASALTLREATLRWIGVYLSLLSGGIGFLFAALPSARSLPDRLSESHCVRG